MKRLISICLLLIIASACKDNKQSVINKLSPDDSAALAARGTLYRNTIPEIEAKRKMIEADTAAQSKFKDLSLSEYLNYKNTFADSTVLNNILEEATEGYNKRTDTLLAKYKARIDSQLNAYKALRGKVDPADFFKVEFISITPKPGSGVYAYVNFKITPLKGPITAGAFQYSIYNKTTQGYLEWRNDCTFKAFRVDGNPFSIYYETLLILDDKYKNLTEDDWKNTCGFTYTVTGANADVHNYQIFENYPEIPKRYRALITQNSLSTSDYIYIISGLYEETPSLYDDYLAAVDRKKKQQYPLAYQYEQIQLPRDPE